MTTFQVMVSVGSKAQPVAEELQSHRKLSKFVTNALIEYGKAHRMIK